MDNLGQPHVTATLPEDLKAQIENARNSVTMMEAEYSRLQKLAFNEKESLERIHGEKTHTESKKKSLDIELEETIKVLAGKKLELEAALTELKNAKTELATTLAESTKLISNQTQKSAEIDARENSVNAREEDINNRLITLVERETNHQAKVEKLKRAIE